MSLSHGGSNLSGELRVPLLLGALPLLASQLSSTPLHMDPQIYYPTQQQLVGARSSSNCETAQHAASRDIGELREANGVCSIFFLLFYFRVII